MSEIDERYGKGKIYTIRCYSDNTKIYVGSTIDTLPRRFQGHKADSKKEKHKNMILYKEVNGNWDDWYIELLKLWPCGCKAELAQQEGKHIREIGNLNKQIAGSTQKEFYTENKEILSEKNKKYYIENKDIINEKKSKERVVCEHCNTSIKKSDLQRHLKTAKCLKAQNRVYY